VHFAGGGGVNRTQISSRILVSYHKTLQILTLNETLSHHIWVGFAKTVTKTVTNWGKNHKFYWIYAGSIPP